MIKCKCINWKNKPKDWYSDIGWLEEKEYHITHVHEMVKQSNIMGFSLAEFTLPPDGKYSCFKASRFAIDKKDLDALLELIKECNELNDVDVSVLTEQLNLELV